MVKKSYIFLLWSVLYCQFDERGDSDFRRATNIDVNKFTKNNSYSLIGSLYFLIAPIFVFRIGMHSALAGQWILLLTLNRGITKNMNEHLIK